MIGGGGGDGCPASIDEGGCCPLHPSIQMARRRRNGKWLQLMKQCPLCSADDDDSEWSSITGSCASSPRSSRSYSRGEGRQKQQRGKSLQAAPPSAFKEYKDGDSSLEASAAKMSPTLISERPAREKDALSDPNDAWIMRQVDLRQRVMSNKFPPLPFAQAENKRAAPEMAKRSKSFELPPLPKPMVKEGSPKLRRSLSEAVPANDEESELERAFYEAVPNDESELDLMDEHNAPRTSSLEALIQDRKDKIRELKMRRLVPPSQRFHQSDDDAWGNAINQRQQERGHGTRRRNDVATRPERRCSFHSASTEQMGNLAKDVHGGGSEVFSFHSDATYHMGTPTDSFHSEAPSRSFPSRSFHSRSFHSGSTELAGNLSTAAKGKDSALRVIDVPSPIVRTATRAAQLNGSTLEISYDSFVEHGGKRGNDLVDRIDSDDMTEVHNNLSPKRRNDKLRTSDSSVSIAESEMSEMDASSFGSNDDLNTASRDIWCDSSGDGSIDSYQRQYNAAKRWLNRTSQTAVHLKESEYDKVKGQLNSLNIDDERNARSKHQREKEVIVEDVSEDESSSEDHQHCGNESQHGEEPPGHTSVTSTKQTEYHLELDPPISDPPDVMMSSRAVVESDSNCTCSSKDEAAKEGLNDYYTAFNEVISSSPLVQKRKSLNSKEQESDSGSDPTSGSNSSGSSSGTESSGPQCFEKKRGCDDTDDAHKGSGNEETGPSIDPSECRRRDSPTSSCAEPPGRRSSSRIRTAPRRPNDRVNISHEASPPKNPGSSSQRREYRRGNSESSEDGEKIFNICDSKGRCIHHPHVQLRRKRRIGGRLKGRWKIIMMNCTECCFEEVQRLRVKNLHTKEQLLLSSHKKAGKPPLMPADNCDTSATESMTSASASSAASSADPRHHAPIGILRKSKFKGNDSSQTMNSNESESTTVFSYLSSLSASSSSAGFSSACSSSTAGTSASSSADDSQNKSPTGILRNSITSSKKSKNSSPASSRSSKSSGRVVFAGRDHIMGV